MNKKTKFLLSFSSVLLVSTSLVSCSFPFVKKEEKETIEKKKQEINVENPNFSLEVNSSVLDNAKLEEIKQIYKKNTENSDSVTDFIKKRSFQIEYVKTFVELYSDDSRRKFVISNLETEFATGWVLDKDPTDERVYYIATNIHAAAFINKPIIKTNSVKLLNNKNDNYFYQNISEEELDNFNSQGIFKPNYNGKMPENYFSSHDIRTLSLIGLENYPEYKNDPYVINDAGKRTKEITENRQNDFYNYKDATFNENFDVFKDKTNIFESFEVIKPLSYQSTFYNYFDLKNGKPSEKEYLSGSDFAVIKIKLKDNVEKPAFLKEYDKSPTLINTVNTTLEKIEGEKVFSFGFPVKIDDLENNKSTRVTEKVDGFKLTKSFYKNGISIINNMPVINQGFQDNEKLTNKPFDIENSIDKDSPSIETIYLANQDLDNYVKVPKSNLFFKGASGAGVFNQNKQAVGIFFSSNAGLKHDDENFNTLNIHRLLEKEQDKSPLIFYLKNVDQNHSWLKQHFNEIVAFNNSLIKK
ncbi:DUF31 family putative serine protease [Mycoplasma sp. Z386]